MRTTNKMQEKYQLKECKPISYLFVRQKDAGAWQAQSQNTDDRKERIWLI